MRVDIFESGTTTTTYGLAVVNDRAVVGRLRDYIATLEVAFDRGQRAVMLAEVLGSLTDLIRPEPVPGDD